MTTLSLIILLAVPFIVGALIPSAPPPFAGPLMGLICVIVTVATLALMIRGYEIDRHELVVRRLFGQTRIDIRNRSRVYHDAGAIRGSWRVYGNGGLFSFSGLFYNRILGRYRLYGTNRQYAVVIILPIRPLVVTPADPEKFIQALS